MLMPVKMLHEEMQISVSQNVPGSLWVYADGQRTMKQNCESFNNRSAQVGLQGDCHCGFLRKLVGGGSFRRWCYLSFNTKLPSGWRWWRRGGRITWFNIASFTNWWNRLLNLYAFSHFPGPLPSGHLIFVFNWEVCRVEPVEINYWLSCSGFCHPRWFQPPLEGPV